MAMRIQQQILSLIGFEAVPEFVSVEQRPPCRKTNDFMAFPTQNG
jgi:hypothetical protein